MMYSVRYVADHDLPAGQDWAVVRTADGDVLAFLKASSVRPTSLAQAWAAARRISAPMLPVPRSALRAAI